MGGMNPVETIDGGAVRRILLCAEGLCVTDWVGSGVGSRVEGVV